MAVGSHAAGVRRRPQLAEQAQLLERGLELRPEHAPFDPLDRAERRLDRGSLPFGAEVRTQPRAQVTGAADVEHPVRAVAEEVDARPGRRPGDEEALAGEPARPRRGEVDDVGHRPRAVLLREAEEREQDLRRRLGVRQCAVAGPRAGAEEVRERGEADAAQATGEQAAGEPDGVDDRRRDPPSRQPLHLAVEEADVEAGVVGDEDGIAREIEEAANRELHRRCAAQRRRVDPGQRRDRRGQGSPRIDERLEPLGEVEAVDPNGADLADRGGAGREAGRLEVDDDVRRRLERDPGARRLGEPDARSAPGEPGVADDDVVEQRAGEPGGDVAERVEGTRGVLGWNRPVAGLDELDEAVGGVERELHDTSLSEHMFACKRETSAAPWTPTGAALVACGGAAGATSP